jgi:putative nucleotidyltransferase with HDIG domain
VSLAALEASDPVRRLREALRGVPGVWLVGGVVRDALLDRPLMDFDLAVRGDARATAQMASRALGGPVFSLSESFGAWRALDGDRRFHVDVSSLQAETIEEDLARRDFTINAMAVPVPGGEPVDPLGGAADLRDGVLRLVSSRAYDEDPLRALRLVRFAAELGFAPDPETERLTALTAPRLSEPSPERVFAELRRLLVADGALAGIHLARRLGVLAAVLPELSELGGIEQSRFHHLDVLGHTIEVLRHLTEIESEPERVFGEQLGPAVAAVLAEPLADDLNRGQALRLGALFHDVGKPATRALGDDARVTFIGHDRAGEQIVGDVFRRLRTSERLRSFVGRLTREHLRLGFLVHQRALDARALHGYLRACQPVEVEVTVLSCADRMATAAPGQEGWIAAHLELAREVMGAALSWRATGPPRAPLRGDELARELSISPGPELGQLLAQLESAVYAGEVVTREQAVAYARRVRDDR